MQRKVILDQLQQLEQLLSSNRQYLSHYSLKDQLKTLLKELVVKGLPDKDLPEDLKLVVTSIREKLDELECKNASLIEKIDFIKECERLIDAGDKDNLDALVEIGEYFGVKKPYRSDVASMLYFVLEIYQLSASKRTLKSKPCLDYLCDLLREKKLHFPTPMSVTELINQSVFQSKKALVDKILAADKSTQLSYWLIGTTQTDREYALRVAASKEGMSNCLLYLLQYTAPTASEDFKISLTAQGQPSGQCALHRAITAKSIYIVLCLMKCTSNDILKQLIVKDVNQLTPLDYLHNIVDAHDRVRVINIILRAIEENKSNPSISLPPDDLDNIVSQLNKIKIMSEEDSYTFGGSQYV